MRRRHVIVSVVVALSILTSVGVSEPPRLINFQGRLMNSNNQPLSGTHTLRFCLYTEANDGTPIWLETQSIATDSDGIYAVILGTLSPLDLDFNAPYWLGLTVNEDPEMAPRFQLLSSAYSLNADRLDGLDSSELVTKVVAGQNVEITPATGRGEITINVPGAAGGDITAVIAGTGLSGGATEKDATLNVGVGEGLTAGSDSISFDKSWGDARYLSQTPQGQLIIRSLEFQPQGSVLYTVPSGKQLLITSIAMTLSDGDISNEVPAQFKVDGQTVLWLNKETIDSRTATMCFPLPIVVPAGKKVEITKILANNNVSASFVGYLVTP